MSIDSTLEKVRGMVSIELERSSNGLAEIAASKLRRAALVEALAEIEAELEPIRQAIKTFPLLANEQEIQWAQAICTMQVCYLEIDTTGLTREDEIVRVTTVNKRGEVECDLLIKPARPLGTEASKANGLTDADLVDAPSLADVWERIQAALAGRYVLSFGQAFDLKKLAEAAARYQLVPIMVIGDDLQRHCTQYYNGEYSLRLAELCERVGHPLESTSAIHRARGQLAILNAMAEGITDVRPPTAKPEAVSPASILHDDGALGDIDEHPF